MRGEGSQGEGGDRRQQMLYFVTAELSVGTKSPEAAAIIEGLKELPTDALGVLLDHCTLKRYVGGRDHHQLVTADDLSLAVQLDNRVSGALRMLSALEAWALTRWIISANKAGLPLRLMTALPPEPEPEY